MTDTTVNLIYRLCEATRPDRKLDLAISVAVNFKGVFTPSEDSSEFVWGAGGDEIEERHNGNRIGFLDPKQFVPRWTESIDFALKLVPEDFYVAMIRHSDGWYVAVAPHSSRSAFPERMGTQKPAAIATCIAAFKARAAGIIP